MKCKALPLIGDLAIAVREGRKTNTRRVLNSQPEYRESNTVGGHFGTWFHGWNLDMSPILQRNIGKYAPLGQIGDRLWVREPGTVVKYDDQIRFIHIRYEDGETRAFSYPERMKWNPVVGHKVPNGIFKEAARTFVEITNVRVERLQDISEDDCWKEGIECVDGVFDNEKICGMALKTGSCIDDAKPLFACLWNSIYSAPKDWDSNPWVWVYEFKQVK